MKKYLLPSSVLAAGSVFAEGPSAAMNTTTATNMMTSVQTGLEAILTAAGPIITAIILAGIGIWAVFAVVRLMKRAFNSGK